MYLNRDIVKFLIECLIHTFGFFITLWIGYAVRELILDYTAPKCKQSEVSTFLPPTCYIRPLKKQRYDI
ncbi:uncharacterized protein NESG_01127 [Nematocida ausubeli]|uniref:Uncharacterized protein n=1 Tax=Nematocida ausubeli (strain ATCC PRA-371 / ERTm2) TaxID=1913371 RepID=A0A086J1J7_NEMA1|nr:uncharacterized protein NESG_01127 [Nematocida ausubeli]KAI5147034.1 hypothetical protein NEAUS05_0365 [Nematocida ausubeli]KFG26015.1 hypothetical protein NESG_01127 [Nematocida ausubeli]